MTRESEIPPASCFALGFAFSCFSKDFGGFVILLDDFFGVFFLVGLVGFCNSGSREGAWM